MFDLVTESHTRSMKSSRSESQNLFPLAAKLATVSRRSFCPCWLSKRLEAIAEELLKKSHHQPGASALLLARLLGVNVVEAALGGREGFAFSDRTVLVDPTGYTPRDEFTVAHEIAELHLPQDWREALGSELWERACDRVASALLLPAAAFKASVVELGVDLPALRRRWQHASWDTLARRLVDVGAVSTAAAWDSLEEAWRYGGEPHDFEEHAVVEALSGRGTARVGAVGAWRLGGEGLGRVVTVA